MFASGSIDKTIENRTKPISYLNSKRKNTLREFISIFNEMIRASNAAFSLRD
jgi:hypothetical protein